MRKTIARMTLLAGLLLVAAAVAGNHRGGPGPADTDGRVSLLGSQAVSAATPTRTLAPAPYIVDQTPPSPTPTSSVATQPALQLATIQLGPYNDASVVSGGMWAPDQNLGGLLELAVGPRQGGVFRSYVRFLLAGLPQGIQIDSARLFLTPTAGGSRPLVVAADVIQDDWNEQSITWNLQPLTTWRAGEATWRPGSSDPVTVDLTAAARNWYACGGTSNNGVALSADLSTDWVGFGSRKSDSPPVLELVYEASTIPVNCSAAPATGVNLATPSVPGPSTQGAQFGSVNPNELANPLIAPLGFCSVLTPICPPGTTNTNVGTTRSTSPAANLGGSTTSGSTTSTSTGFGTPTNNGTTSTNSAGPAQSVFPTPTPSPIR